MLTRRARAKILLSQPFLAMPPNHRAQSATEPSLSDEAHERRRRLANQFIGAAATNEESLVNARAMLDRLQSDRRYRPAPKR